MAELTGKTVAIVVEQIYDEREFWYPKIRLLEAGATVLVAGPEGGEEYPGKYGMPAKADIAFAQLNSHELDGIIVPGGFAPDYIRRSKECLTCIAKLNEQKKLIAFICHAGWVPASAGVLKGKRVTSCPSIKDDLVNAGAIWENSALVQDGNIISSRNPLDLPEFMPAVIHFLKNS